jgi:hypothetical protein
MCDVYVYGCVCVCVCVCIYCACACLCLFHSGGCEGGYRCGVIGYVYNGVNLEVANLRGVLWALRGWWWCEACGGRGCHCSNSRVHRGLVAGEMASLTRGLESLADCSGMSLSWW